MNLKCLVAAGVFLAATPALAGDFAKLNPLGFSEDGSVFAFEQYGIQDGSGFPYAEIFFLDLESDQFLDPSPVRIRLDEDGSNLADARSRARDEAVALFEAHAPERNRGLVVAANPPTELMANPHRVAFLPRAIEPTPDDPFELRLTLLPENEAPEHCTAFGHAIAGFRLARIDPGAAGATAVLHEDASVPESRRCPYDYRIAEVWVHDAQADPKRAVAIIGVKSVGFEGPDMRYIAVPVPLD